MKVTFLKFESYFLKVWKLIFLSLKVIFFKVKHHIKKEQSLPSLLLNTVICFGYYSVQSCILVFGYYSIISFGCYSSFQSFKNVWYMVDPWPIRPIVPQLTYYCYRNTMYFNFRVGTWSWNIKRVTTYKDILLKCF